MGEAQYEHFLGFTHAQRSSAVAQIRKDESAADELQLSRAQRRMWFLQQAAPFDPSFNITEAWRISGPLDLDALNAAISRIAERHESLSTRFMNVDGMPVRLVSSQPIHVDVTMRPDLQSPSDVSDKFIRSLAEKEAARPFDLAAEPLFRCRVIVLDACDHLLVVTMHHIISDGESFEVFYRELGQFYQAYVYDTSAKVAGLSTQYIDSVSDERALLDSEWQKKEIAFWRQELADVQTILDLPNDHLRSVRQNFSDSFAEKPIPASVMTSLSGLAGREKVASSIILLSAYAVLLYRYTGQDDLLIGIPVAGRSLAERNLIGLFVNTVVLRIDVSGDPAFIELLHHVRDVAIRARMHARLPFDLLVERLKPARIPGRNPLCQVFFAHDKAPSMDSLGDAQAAKIEVNYPMPADFDLALSIVDDQHGMSKAILRYSSSVFEHSTIERILADYFTVLFEVTENLELRTKTAGSLDRQVSREMLAASGELDRHALLTPRQVGATSRPPDTPTEIAIASIWREVLTCGPMEAQDDFFEIGGHSALAIQIVFRVEQELDVRLPVSAVFEAPTVEALAEVVDRALWLNASDTDTSNNVEEREEDVL